MKITINTEILKRHNLSLGEFLIMLLGYFEIDVKFCQDNTIRKLLVEKNIFDNSEIILSNNSKNLIAQILMESDDKATQSGIDFNDLAQKLMNIYPNGTKPGKTYSWRGTVDEIAQKLRTLVVKYDFLFTEEEAINATMEYINSFDHDYQRMHTLKNFLLFTYIDGDRNRSIESHFMTIIENHRDS